MKFNIKDEDLVTRDLEEAISRLPLEWKLKGHKPKDIFKIFTIEEILEVIKPEERLKGLPIEGLKKLKEILDKLNLN